MVTVPFDRVSHLIRVPVLIAGEPYRFLVDTGIGLTVVSPVLAARPEVEATGSTTTARRMSGQEIVSPLVRLPVLTLGSWSVDGHVAAVADFGEVDGPNGFAGILGLDLFADQVLTIDPAAMTLTVQSPASFSAAGGYPVPLEIDRDGTSIDTFTKLILPSGREVTVEVDTGSANLILDTRFMPDCGVELGDPAVETKTGTDETGYQWTRHWSTVAGEIHLSGAPETAQSAARVQFQDIIYEGLIGTDYLDRYRTSVDISGSRLILSPRS
jgi:hypothetical protein